MHRPGVRWIRMATPHPRRGTGTAPRGGLLLGQRHRDMDEQRENLRIVSTWDMRIVSFQMTSLNMFIL